MHEVQSSTPNFHSLLTWYVLKEHIPKYCHAQDYNTARKHSLEVYRNRPVCLSVCLSVRLSGPTSTSFVRFPPNFVEFKIMMCKLCSIKDLYCPLSLALLCLFGLRNFQTIQYSLCHRKFSYMINQNFLKLCTLQDSNMKMCTLVGYPGPLSFTAVMLLWTQKF